MAEITVRTAVVGDAAAVLDLHVRARSTVYQGFLDEDQLSADNRRDIADYQRMITREDRAVRCAEISGRLVGFVVLGPPYYPDPDPTVGIELYQIQVAPLLFSSGIGTRLHDSAREIWRGTTRAARLWTWEFNERAWRFYDRHGWTPDGHCRPDDPRIDGYRMLAYRLPITH
jgi:GNAT superfamily N-acetyltransferase